MADSRDFRPRLRAVVWRTLLLAFGWWALKEEERDGLSFGACVILLATLTSVAVTPLATTPLRLRAIGCARLVWLFAIGSLRGGWDVALRALSPRLELAPVVVRHSTRLAPGVPRRLFTTLVTLMPGTLSVDARGRDLSVHALVDSGETMRTALEALETTVAEAVALAQPTDEAADA